MFTHQLQKTITNSRADAMKGSCSDTLMYFHNKNRPFSESHHRLDLHLCDSNIILCRIRRLFIVSALPFETFRQMVFFFSLSHPLPWPLLPFPLHHGPGQYLRRSLLKSPLLQQFLQASLPGEHPQGFSL